MAHSMSHDFSLHFVQIDTRGDEQARQRGDEEEKIRRVRGGGVWFKDEATNPRL